MLELAAEEARVALGAAALSVSRWDRERGVMRTLINAGELTPGVERFPADEEYPLDQAPLLRRMLETGQPYFNSIDDPEADPVAVALLREHGNDSDMAVPIIVEGTSWGEVWAATAPGQPRFQAADLSFLGAVAGQLAVAIGRAELFSRVSRLAYEDPLTGLANRRALEERLHGALDRARRRGTPVSVLLCDLDNLKQLNDELGHAAGDRALVRVAEALVEASADRPGSLVTRLAGDEFCVLLEGGDLDAARALGAAIFEALAARRDSALSLSCGAAAADGATSTPALVLRAADAALYAAKRRGGGRVCTLSEAAPSAPAGERRLHRGSVAQRIRGAVALAVERLDGALAGAAPLERLEAVAALFAEALNAAGWSVSFAPAGAGVVRSVSAADDRDSRLRGARVGLDAEVYALSDFPATAALLSADAGGLVVRRDDAGADAAERALLDELGYDAVLAAVASGDGGAYMIELFADERTARLEDALPELRVTAPAAVPATAERPAESARRLDELVVTLARRLAEATDERAACEAVAEELDRGLGARLSAVVRVRAGAIEPVALRGRAAMPAGWRQPSGAGLIGRSVGERSTVLVGDVRAEPQFRVTRWTRETRSELVVPVLAGGGVWGAINLEHDEPGAFDASHVGPVEAAAALLGARLPALAASPDGRAGPAVR